MSDGERLVIKSEDLPPAEPEAPPPPPPPVAVAPGPPMGNAAGWPPIAGTTIPPPSPVAGAPRTLPSVQGARPTPKPVALGGAAGINFGSTLVSNTVASAVAALSGWALFRLFFAHEFYFTHLVLHSAEEIAVFGAAFGAVFAAWDDAVSRVWESAGRTALLGALLGVICGAASGAIAQEIFTKLVKNMMENSTDFQGTYESADFFLARGLAWAIFGGGIGVALGMAKRSSRKSVNAAIGGVIGGAVGGIVFHWAGLKIEDESTAQLIGFAVVGLGIGVAVGLVEVARRQAWLKISTGGMVGKEFIIYHAATHIGSAPKCEITLIKDAEVSPYHCRIDDHGGRYSISAFEGCPMRINGTPASSHWLQAGDAIELGRTTLNYNERRLTR
jgi:Inner membrane component of T3SS, cytoplasmic domain